MSTRVLIFFACAALIGCAEKVPRVAHPPLIKVAGSVTYKGAPVDAAIITFSSSETNQKGWVAHAVSDASGKFAVATTFGGDQTEPGAVAGQYKVLVTKVKPAPPPSHEEMAKMPNPNEAPPVAPPENLVPAKYGSAETTDLEAKVPASGEYKLDLQLKDE